MTEGQGLPELRKKILLLDRWDPDVGYPWDEVKNVYDSYWDHTKPILLDKTPPNICRATQIVKHFSPAYFLLMVRNPYVHCASLIKHGVRSPSAAAEEAILHLKYQIDNKEKLDNILCFSYEEFTDNPKLMAQRIQSFIPQIGELKYNKKFSIGKL